MIEIAQRRNSQPPICMDGRPLGFLVYVRETWSTIWLLSLRKWLNIRELFVKLNLCVRFICTHNIVNLTSSVIYDFKQEKFRLTRQQFYSINFWRSCGVLGKYGTQLFYLAKNVISYEILLLSSPCKTLRLCMLLRSLFLKHKIWNWHIYKYYSPNVAVLYKYTTVFRDLFCIVSWLL